MKERHEQILALLKANGNLSTGRLARLLYVSEMTIRRDLQHLEQGGYIQRYCGGAMLYAEAERIPFDRRKLLRSEAKHALAKQAAALVTKGDTVFIDSSSSCMYLIGHLASIEGIQIITNSLTSVSLAIEHHIPCMMVGGRCYEKDLCTVGGMAMDMLRTINTDIAFFSSMAISDDGMITDCDEEQTAVRRLVLQNTAKAVFLFTKEKQHKKQPYTLCHRDTVYKVLFE